jgi:thioredoxin-related protein
VTATFPGVLVRVLLAAVLVVVTFVIAAAMQRRRRPAPPVQGRGAVPQQLDRADFPRPDAPWLVVLFSSSTCDTCAGMREKVAALESDQVAVADLEYSAHKDLHARYRIDAVPLVVVADADGVTRASFLGATSATDLWNAIAELRG